MFIGYYDMHAAGAVLGTVFSQAVSVMFDLAAISAICSQCIGSKQHERAAETLRYGCFIAVGFGIFFTVICQFASESILFLFTGEEIVVMASPLGSLSSVVICVSVYIYLKRKKL